MDLNHAVPFTHPTRVWAGDYSDCAGATVTVLAAGVGQKPGQSRLDCLQANASIWREIVPQIAQHNPGGILLVATNPVDALTYAAWKLSELPATRVLGSGTILDTARFRFLLSQHFGVDARSVHAYIIGEHGDSEVPIWSLANIAGCVFPTIAARTAWPTNRNRCKRSLSPLGTLRIRSSREREPLTTRWRRGCCGSHNRSCAIRTRCSQSQA